MKKMNLNKLKKCAECGNFCCSNKIHEIIVKANFLVKKIRFSHQKTSMQVEKQTKMVV